MSRAVANTLLPAERPASTMARPRPRELPVTNHTCAIQSSYLRSPSYFDTARAAGNTVQQQIRNSAACRRHHLVECDLGVENHECGYFLSDGKMYKFKREEPARKSNSLGRMIWRLGYLKLGFGAAHTNSNQRLMYTW